MTFVYVYTFAYDSFPEYKSFPLKASFVRKLSDVPYTCACFTFESPLSEKEQVLVP